jgi:hypothetical protein
MTQSTDESDAGKPNGDLTAEVRDTAYFLWEQDGRPAGREDYYWSLALEQHLRTRAFDVWLREGRPEGRERENWREAERNFSERRK